jgi:hypothetical protein
MEIELEPLGITAIPERATKSVLEVADPETV